MDDRVFDPLWFVRRAFISTLLSGNELGRVDSAFSQPYWSSYQLANRYHCSQKVLEAVALHHHVKIRPRTLNLIGDALNISSIVRLDIFHYNPAQYAAPGNVSGTGHCYLGPDVCH